MHLCETFFKRKNYFYKIRSKAVLNIKFVATDETGPIFRKLQTLENKTVQYIKCTRQAKTKSTLTSFYQAMNLNLHLKNLDYINNSQYCKCSDAS